MVNFNHAVRQMMLKIVYYGPGLCGKTTNLQFIYGKVSSKARGEMVSLNTESDRTLFFDLLPLDIGTIGGFKTKLQLYTVPGQVFYDATRKLVLRGADGVVFVADSQESMRDSNRESLENLAVNLKEYGYDINTMPLVFQWNKRDLKSAMSVEQMEADLNYLRRPSFCSVAASKESTNGVFDTMKAITKLAVEDVKRVHFGENIPALGAPPVVAAAPVVTPPPVVAPPVVVQPPPVAHPPVGFGGFGGQAPAPSAPVVPVDVPALRVPVAPVTEPVAPQVEALVMEDLDPGPYVGPAPREVVAAAVPVAPVRPVQPAAPQVPTARPPVSVPKVGVGIRPAVPGGIKPSMPTLPRVGGMPGRVMGAEPDIIVTLPADAPMSVKVRIVIEGEDGTVLNDSLHVHKAPSQRGGSLKLPVVMRRG